MRDSKLLGCEMGVLMLLLILCLWRFSFNCYGFRCNFDKEINKGYKFMGLM